MEIFHYFKLFSIQWKENSLKWTKLIEIKIEFSINFCRIFLCVSQRDEILTKNKFLEDEAKRKAEAVENGEDQMQQQDAPEDADSDDSQQEDDVFYDSDAAEQEEE